MAFNLLQKYKKIKQAATTIKWDIPWPEEASYLNILTKARAKKPPNGIFDAIYQYKAQTFGANRLLKFVLQLVSLSSAIYLAVKAIATRIGPVEQKDVAYFYSLSIFSDAVKRDKTFGFVGGNNVKLYRADFLFLLRVFAKTRFNFCILSASIFRIGQIRYAMATYKVSEIWTNMEYSPSCGVVYDYCKQYGLKMNNFMHGEKVMTLKDSFTIFDAFYVWDNHYKAIFETLNCQAEIIVDNPWLLQDKKIEKEETGKICYFLNGIETAAEIVVLNNALLQLYNKGYQVYYKRHPRQLGNYSLSKQFIEFNEFHHNNIPSLYHFDYIIAQFSTILFQCFCNNQKVIIDDVTNEKFWHKLEERKYYFAVNAGNSILKLSRLL